MENQTQTPTPIRPIPTYSVPPVPPATPAPSAPQMPPAPPVPPTPPTPPPVQRPPVVPPSYIPPVMPSGEGPSGARMILPALLLVLIIGGAYYWYASRSTQPAYTPVVAPTTTTPVVSGEPASNVAVAKSDISAGSPNKLPDGFPTAIPVEQAGITDSFKAVYKDQGVTQYTVSYVSKKSTDDVWTLYNTYLTNAGYKIDTVNTSKSLGSLRASKDKSDISIGITKGTSGTLVAVSLLVR